MAIIDYERKHRPGARERQSAIDKLPHNMMRRLAYGRSDQGKASWLIYHESALGRATKRRHYLKKYGITDVQYEMMYRRQGGCCDICKQPYLGGKRLCVDHNHETGRVRGLLCSSCNLIVGHSKEDFRILESAKDYLDKWKRISGMEGLKAVA